MAGKKFLSHLWLHLCSTFYGIVFAGTSEKKKKRNKILALPGAQNSCGAIGFADGSPARAFTHGCSALCMGDSTLSNPSRAISILVLKAWGGLTPLSLPPPSHSTMHQSHGLRNSEKEGKVGLWSHIPFFLPIKEKLNKAGVCKNWIHQPGHVEQMSRPLSRSHRSLYLFAFFFKPEG